MTMPDAWRSLFAECRAVESGQNARWSDEQHCFLVCSESEPGVDRQVTVSGLVVHGRVHLLFACSCPQGTRGRGISSGRTACRHAALLARRLQREKLAFWRDSDNRWLAAGMLREAALEQAFDGSDEPPGVLDAPGHRARRPAMDDADKVAAQLRAGLA